MGHTPPADPLPLMDEPADWEHHLLGHPKRARRAAEPRADTSNPTPPWTAEEQAVLDYHARDLGRPLTRQEANLIIGQAYWIGTL